MLGLKYVSRTQAFFVKPSRLNLTSFFSLVAETDANNQPPGVKFIETNVDCNRLSDCFPFLGSGSFVIGS